jgi:hypothetical protein
LHLSSEKPVSKFPFKCNLHRYGKGPSAGVSERTLMSADRKFNAAKYLDSVVAGTKQGELLMSKLGESRERAERWGATGYKAHDVDRWNRVRTGEMELDVVDRAKRAQDGKLVVDHSEATHIIEVYVESCRAAGIVPNTRAKRGLLEQSCDLAHAALGRGGMSALGLALQINTTVTYLDLRDNDIDDLGFKDIMHGLMDNGCLRVLDLSNNPGPGKRGMEAMCNVLDPDKRKSPTIAELRLQRCHVSSVQGAALFKALVGPGAVHVECILPRFSKRPDPSALGPIK